LHGSPPLLLNALKKETFEIAVSMEAANNEGYLIPETYTGAGRPDLVTLIIF